jgi:hypothetical protein
MDRLDIDATMALMAPEGSLMTADGRHAEGAPAVRQLLTEFFGALRSTSHHITAQWHEDTVWIAEVDSSYELQDWLQMTALPRVFILRDGPHGFVDLRVYGARERPITEHRTGEEGTRVGDRWIPPL